MTKTNYVADKTIALYISDTMEIEDSSDTDCELVIDETIIVSSDEEDCISRLEGQETNILAEKLIQVAANEENSWPNEGIYKNLFHPESISSADMKDELFLEETNTCSICNESFKYNVGLLYHMEVEHKDDIKEKKKRITKRIGKKAKKLVCNSNIDALSKVCVSGLTNENLKITTKVVFKKSCEICKKTFTDQNKWTKHVDLCLKIGLKFQCMYCKCKFGWESKYKKHLFKTHKLNAAVICKSCSRVYSDMDSLATHIRQCDNKKADDGEIPYDMEW